MDTDKKRIAHIFFQTTVPLLFLLLPVLIFLYFTETQNLKLAVLERENHQLELARHMMQSELKHPASDAFFLAHAQDTAAFLSDKNAAAKQRLISLVDNLMLQRKAFDQVRVIDLQGHEILRVNYQQSRTYVVRDFDLQDKSQRYYVEYGEKLEANSLYISPLDLNVENGIIEDPHKAVLRLVAPVFSSDGQRLGMVVLNYLGQALLDEFSQLSGKLNGEFWLLNEAGYWLFAENTNWLWGEQLPSNAKHQLMQSFPAFAHELQRSQRSGQIMVNGEVFTYREVSLTELLPAANSPRWVMATHIDKSAWQRLRQKTVLKLAGVLSVVGLFMAIVSVLLTQRYLAKQKSLDDTQKSLQQTRVLIDSAPDSIVIVNGQGEIQMINREAEQKFGYTRSELQGAKVETLLPERFQKKHVTYRDHYLEKPSLRAMGDGVDLYAKAKDGTEFPVEISLNLLERDNQNWTISIVRDITSRKMAEAAQKESEVRYQQLVASLPVGVFKNPFREDVEWGEVNAEILTLLGVPDAQTLHSHNFNACFSNLEDYEVFCRNLLDGGKVNGQEILLKNTDGHTFFASVSAVLYEDEYNGRFVNGIVEDISQRKLSEEKILRLNRELGQRSLQLETINKELESFSYSVSHDLRQPLRAMDGFSRTLSKDYAQVLDARGQDRLSRIRTAAQRMAALIDDMLNLSRVSRTEVTREKVDLAPMVHEIVENLRQAAPERRVDIEVQEPLQVYCDKRLVRMVLENLVGNAWKFTSKVEHASISIRFSDQNDHVIVVQDNGAGFEMEYANKLFGAFQRLHDAAEFPGTGIGLATVQRVVSKHGGRVWAESEVGSGASFYFTLGGEVGDE